MEKKRSVWSLNIPTIARAQNYWKVAESFHYINSVIILNVEKKRVLIQAPPHFRQWEKNIPTWVYTWDAKLKNQSNKDKRHTRDVEIILRISFFGGGRGRYWAAVQQYREKPHWSC